MRRLLAWGLAAASCLLLLLTVVVAARSGAWDDLLESGPLLGLLGLVVPATGLFIALRRPDHPTGWLYLYSGFLVTLSFASIAYAEYALLEPNAVPGPDVAAWLGSWVWAPGFIMLVTLPFLLFPDGHLPSSRWRPAAWLAVGALLLAIGHAAFSLGTDARVLLRGDELDGPAAALFLASLLLGAIAMVAAVVSLFVRYRTATLEQRQQLKWFMAAGILFVLGVPFAFEPLLNVPGAKLISDAVPYALPIATAVAIAKYRLYDIDRIVSRALTYAVLTALLGLTYFGVVVLMQSLLGGFATGSQIAVAASTLVVAALFRPLKGRVQQVIDRRFYRARYDAAATVERFSERLRVRIELTALGDELVSVVHQTMQPAQCSLWLKAGGPNDAEDREGGQV